MLLSEYLKILLDYSDFLSEYLEFPSDFRFPLQKYELLKYRFPDFSASFRILPNYAEFFRQEGNDFWR